MPSKVIDRDHRETWYNNGALDINARAHQRVEELISAYKPLSLETDVLRELEGIAGRHAQAAGLHGLPELSSR